MTQIYQVARFALVLFCASLFLLPSVQAQSVATFASDSSRTEEASLLSLEAYLAKVRDQYPEIIQEGLDHQRDSSFVEAIRSFQAALRANPEKADTVNTLILDTFELIDGLRVLADSNHVRAEAALEEAKEANEKAQQFISLFFDDAQERASWSYDNISGRFQVVDREGNPQGEGSIWDTPSPFDNNVAIASKGGEYFFIDAQGNPLSVGYQWLHPTTSSLVHVGILADENNSGELVGVSTTGTPILMDDNALQGMYERISDKGAHQEWESDEASFTEGSSALQTLLNYFSARQIKLDSLQSLGHDLFVAHRNESNYYYQLSDGSVNPVRVGLRPLFDTCQGIRMYDNMGRGKWGVMHEGKLVTDLAFDQIWAAYVADNYVRVMVRDNNRDQFGFISCDGVHDTGVLSGNGFDDALLYGPGIVRVRNGREWFLIDHDGHSLPADTNTYDNIGYPREYGLATYTQNGLRGYLDRNGRPVTEAIYDWVGKSDDVEKVGQVKKGNYYGVVALHMGQTSPIVYDTLSTFNDDFALATKDHQWGLVSRLYGELIPTVHDSLALSDDGIEIFSSGHEPYTIRHLYGNLFAKNADGKVGIVDGNGNEVVEPLYATVGPIIIDDHHAIAEVATSRRKGLIAKLFSSAKQGSGLIDLKALGAPILEPAYVEVGRFDDGFALVQSKKKSGLVNMKGEIVLGLNYDEIGSFDQHGYAPVKAGESWGIIRQFGDQVVEVFEPAYEQVGASMGQFVFVKEDGKWGVADTTMTELAILPKYDFVGKFQDGVALVRQDGKWGALVMNTPADSIMEVTPVFDEIGTFRNGYAPIRRGEAWAYVSVEGRYQEENLFDDIANSNIFDGFKHVRSGRYWGILDGQNAFLVEPRFSAIEQSGIHDLALVQDRGLWGLVSKKGIILEPQLDIIEPFSNEHGLARVQLAGQYGLINSKGRFIAEPRYDYIEMLEDGSSIVQVQDRWGIIDATGNSLLPIQFEALQLVSDSFITYKLDNNVGLLDLNRGGELIEKLVFETPGRSIQQVSDHLYAVSKNIASRELTFYNQRGEEINPCRRWVQGGIRGCSPITIIDIIDVADDERALSDHMLVQLAAQSGGGPANDQRRVEGDLCRGRCAFMDSSGVVDDFIYQAISNFQGGYYLGELQSMDGIVDIYGNVIVNPVIPDSLRITKNASDATRFDVEKTVRDEEQDTTITLIGIFDILPAYQQYPQRYFYLEPTYTSIRKIVGKSWYLVQQEDQWRLMNELKEEVACEGELHGEISEDDLIRLCDANQFENNREREENEKGYPNPKGDWRASPETGKWGFMRPDSTLLIDYKYDISGKDFSDGLAAVRVGEDWGFINHEDSLIIGAQFEDVRSFSEQIAAVKKDGKWGYISLQGDVVIDYWFERAMPFEDGLAPVQYRSDWLYISPGGNLRVRVEASRFNNRVDSLYAFRHGCAVVRFKQEDASSEGGNAYHYGLIDRGGRSLLGANTYRRIRQADKAGLVKVNSNRKKGLVNCQGQVLVPWEYDRVRIPPKARPGVYEIVNGSRIGIVVANSEGVQRFIEPQYEKIALPYDEDMLPVKRDGKWGFVRWVPSTVESDPFVRRVPSTVESDPDEGQYDGCLENQDNPSADLMCIIPPKYDAWRILDDGKNTGSWRAQVYVSDYDLDFVINERGEMLTTMTRSDVAK